MKTIYVDELCHFSGGYERGPVGEAICSSLGALVTTVLGYGLTRAAVLALFPTLGEYFTGLTIGMALGCFISDWF